jgi:hypothetical protein
MSLRQGTLTHVTKCIDIQIIALYPSYYTYCCYFGSARLTRCRAPGSFGSHSANRVIPNTAQENKTSFETNIPVPTSCRKRFLCARKHARQRENIIWFTSCSSAGKLLIILPEYVQVRALCRDFVCTLYLSTYPASKIHTVWEWKVVVKWLTPCVLFGRSRAQICPRRQHIMPDVLSGYHESVQAIAGIVPYIRQRQLFSTIFPIHYSGSSFHSTLWSLSYWESVVK